jgi:DNA polymerase III epsilon subunit-like protein
MEETQIDIDTELTELQAEENRLLDRINEIAKNKGIKGKELDEFWTLINQYVDNQTELESWCNQ